MKLRNKKTGEMGIVSHFDNQSIVIYPVDENWNAKGDKKYIFHSLAELNEEWEDVEEPIGHWAIDMFGEPIDTTNLSSFQLKKLQRYGNDFPTEEEAELAVRKLKAWKRLKDKGFRFDGWNVCDSGKGITIFANYPSGTKAYLDLLFGGEE